MYSWCWIVLLVLSAAAILWYFKFFLFPLRRLIDISRKIADGQFPQTIIFKSRFSLGELEISIEQMSQRLAEKFDLLSAERGQLKAVLSGMAEGVLAVDERRRIMLANPAFEKLFAVTGPEIVGQSVRLGVRNNELAALFEEGAASREISILSPVEKTFIAHVSPLEHGGAVCVLYDITELRKLERYRSDFVANVSHELKTPLTAIRNYTETLLGGAIEDKAHNREFLEKIDKHAINLSSLIEDILELSRLESKSSEFVFEQVELAPLISQALETVSQKAKSKNIAIASQIEPAQIKGIPDQILRALLNLLDNAVNYTPAGGKVGVVCRKEQENIVIEISDTGIGIAPEHLPRIFERFYRVDQARSRELGGTGLGLAIVKHIMQVHGGQVAVESVVGKGTKFILVFPAN